MTRRTIFHLAMILIPFTVLPFLAEGILAIVRYPIVPLVKAAHPPNYRTTYKNIEFQYEFVTNDMGIRYPDIPLAKPANETRIMMLGDSYTEGLGVGYEHTFGFLLENKFSRPERMVRFINGGLEGTGPLEYAKLFNFVGLKYSPDLTLIFLHVNDVTDTPVFPEEILKNQKEWLEGSYPKPPINRALHFFFPRFYTLLRAVKEREETKETIDLVKLTKKYARKKHIKEEEVDAWISKLPKELLEAANRKEFNGNFLTAAFAEPDRRVKNIDLKGDDVQAKWETMIEILNNIVRLSREREIPVAVVLTPSPLLYDENYGNFESSLGVIVKREWAREETILEREIKKWTDNQNLPYLNLAPHFRELPAAEKKELYYRLDGHWTQAGNQFVADIIENWLKSSRLIQ